VSNVAINIAAEFTGKPAFKKAETSVDRLEKRTKNLGKTLTRTFGTAAVLAFGRASVKAFAEDDKAATALGQTLKNLNLAYGSNIGTVNGFINRLESQTGVLDDELRPAMDRLLRATGDVTKSQELLGLALDIAAGTGKSVTQVSQSLQKAYLGQTQALGRLGVGLSKVELSSSSFEEIQQRLTTLFAGQASAAAETFAGQLDKLTIAANNAKETIGKGLYDAITALSGGGTTAATDNIDKLATSIADSLKNTGEFINRLEDLKPVLIAVGVVAAAAFLPITTAIAGAIFLMGDLNKRLNEQTFRKGIIPGGMGNISMTVSSQDTQRADKAAAAAAAKQIKATNTLTKAQKDQVKLAKAKAIFDLQKIQIEAALKGKLSEEDRLRLKLMQAIEEENITQIEKYTKLVNEAQAKTLELVNTLSKLKFPELEVPTILQPNGKEFSSFTSLAANTTIQPNLREYSSSFSPSAMNPAAAMPVTPSAPTVIVNVEGSVIAENNLAQTINDAIASSNQSGSAVGYKRQAGLTAV
jgi:hypothetical protein